MGSQHPGGFFVGLEKAREKIGGGWLLVGFITGFDGSTEVSDDSFMAREEAVKPFEMGAFLAGLFREGSVLKNFRQGAWGGVAEGSDSFGDIVGGGVESVVLLPEERMKGVEMGTYDIPVGIAGEHSQQKSIGKNGDEQICHSPAGGFV
jgi:hypothetical protein